MVDENTTLTERELMEKYSVQKQENSLIEIKELNSANKLKKAVYDSEHSRIVNNINNILDENPNIAEILGIKLDKLSNKEYITELMTSIAIKFETRKTDYDISIEKARRELNI